MVKSLREELKVKVERQANKNLAKLRQRYRMLRKLGLSSDEARIASFWAEDKLNRLMEELKEEE